MSDNNDPGPLVLSVEDDPGVGRLLRRILKQEGFHGKVTETGEAFLEALSKKAPDLCLVDLELPDIPGLDLLKRLSEEHPGVPAVVLTGSGSVQDAVKAMKRGAVDFLCKPVEAHRIGVTLRNALRMREYKHTVARLRAEIPDAYAPEHMVGSSEAMGDLRSLIARAAGADVDILITGETGTGKELVARGLHYTSSRREGPFVDVNCPALTETLLESELFGHEKGAFTGALDRRQGRFEKAHGGTIFLDEIGDMPLSTQAKILRVLQERRFFRVGGDASIEVDVRVICATNQDLQEGCAKGTFRQDLLYRINTLTIGVPPLRDRRSDIPELSHHFLQRASQRQKRGVSGISADAMSLLERHDWPGNVRELEHAIDRAVLLCDGDAVTAEHLPAGLTKAARPPGAEPAIRNLVSAVEQLERSMILGALKMNRWVKARAARALGVTERVISYKMLSLGIRPPDK